MSLNDQTAAQVKSQDRADERMDEAREAVMDSKCSVYWRDELKRNPERLVAIVFAGRPRLIAAAQEYHRALADDNHPALPDVVEGWLDDVLDIVTGKSITTARPGKEFVGCLDASDAFEDFRDGLAARFIREHCV